VCYMGCGVESGEWQLWVDISKGVWHMVEALELGSVVFECKEGRMRAHRGRTVIQD